ncbi:PspC domain-containing protein [Candidatus Kaiserbacteria bacterium]|nr:PspC domain-containing protein [Candidatus Kaiserbacteria bacterium]
MEPKRLYRSKENKIFAGICGGLGDYFSIDPTLLRLAWLLVVIFTGIFPGVVVYILAIFVIPEKREQDTKEHPHATSL